MRRAPQVGPVPAGDLFSPSDLERLDRAVGNAERLCGLPFSVYVGRSDRDSRAYSERLHNRLADPERSVLILCDPARRALEIVTGAEAHRALDDLECRLAAATMQTSFAAGDLLGGLLTGIAQLGEAAREPRTLHAR